MVELFEFASRKKLRFETRIGNLSAEDLWDLALTSDNPQAVSLDEVERGLNKALKESDAEESYVVKLTIDNIVAKTRLGIVRRIIDHKLEYAARAEKAATTKAKKEQIVAILHEKKEGALKEHTAEELEKMLEDM